MKIVAQVQRGVPGASAAGPQEDRDPRRGRFRARRARANSGRQVALVRPEADEKVANRRDAAAAAHHVGEADHGRDQLRLCRQALQDVQGPQVPLHADGALPRGRALDRPPGQGPL